MSFVQILVLKQHRDSKVGGARRDRTADLLRARQALSQLSYGPLTCLFFAWPRCSLRSVGQDPNGHSLLRSACALPAEKNPASAFFRDAATFVSVLADKG